LSDQPTQPPQTAPQPPKTAIFGPTSRNPSKSDSDRLLACIIRQRHQIPPKWLFSLNPSGKGQFLLGQRNESYNPVVAWFSALLPRLAHNPG